MRALAEVLAGWGWELTGSDVSSSAIKSHDLPADLLRLGHAAENVPLDANILIYSDAVAADNIELRRAAELGIPTVSYFQFVGQLTERLRCAAVAGTHGKSTTTAMAARILNDAKLDPTVICGAAAPGEASGGRAGRSDLILVEACEYRRNFLQLKPRWAAILGIEPDHFDCYKSPQELHEAFSLFAASIDADGVLLARHDCPATRTAARAAACRVETFGFEQYLDGHTPNWSASILDTRAGCCRFEIFFRHTHFCDVSLRVPGRHNVLNALAAVAISHHQGVNAEQICQSLGEFPGLERRLQCLGTWRGVTVLDDYAHHPTEVTASLDTVRRMYPGRRIFCVFQPHQASRTANLLDELAASLQNVDCLAVAEIFRAREGNPKPGEVTAADLARLTAELGAKTLHIHTLEEIHYQLINQLQPGDVLITIGAGDIRRIADGYIHWTREERAAG